jgi:pilus assembly protein Flp/PilA
MLKSIKKFVKDNSGQSMAEYALILALVTVVVIAAVTALGGKISSVFETITAAIPG